MQNVACPMTIVSSEKFTPPKVKNEFSAMPVMIPGRAIGSTITNDTASRPKNRNRCTAKAAIEPSVTAIVVAISAALTDSHSDWRIASLFQVEANHFVERWLIGQLCTVAELKA